MLVPARAQPPH